MRRLRALALALASIACGCHGVGEGSTSGGDDGGTDAGPPPFECTLPFVGDDTKDPTLLDVIALGPTSQPSNVVDGGPVSLMFPPQGGFVIFVGLRATNVDPCAVTLTGALRDLATQAVTVDERTVNLVVAADGASAAPGTSDSDFANVSACSNTWSSTNIPGNNYGLEMTMTDRRMRTATAKLTVVPECDEPGEQALCVCICQAGYVLGQLCDGGTGAGGGSSSTGP